MILLINKYETIVLLLKKKNMFIYLKYINASSNNSEEFSKICNIMSIHQLHP